MQHVTNVQRERDFKRRGKNLSATETGVDNLGATLPANVTAQSCNIEEQGVQGSGLPRDTSREEAMLKKERRASNARADQSKDKDRPHAMHGQQLHDLTEEEQEEMAGVKSELTTWEKEAMEQHAELKRRTEVLDTQEAKKALEDRELTRCQQELERRLQKVQDGLIEETRRRLGVTYVVEEELIEMA